MCFGLLSTPNLHFRFAVCGIFGVIPEFDPFDVAFVAFQVDHAAVGIFRKVVTKFHFLLTAVLKINGALVHVQRAMVHQDFYRGERIVAIANVDHIAVDPKVYFFGTEVDPGILGKAGADHRDEKKEDERFLHETVHVFFVLGLGVLKLVERNFDFDGLINGAVRR